MLNYCSYLYKWANLELSNMFFFQLTSTSTLINGFVEECDHKFANVTYLKDKLSKDLLYSFDRAEKDN